MTITNNTSSDIAFEIDVDSPLKGQVANVVVAANSTCDCTPVKGLMLAMDSNFQAQITAGNITLSYAAADITWGAAVLAYFSQAL